MSPRALHLVYLTGRLLQSAGQPLLRIHDPILEFRDPPVPLFFMQNRCKTGAKPAGMVHVGAEAPVS